MILFPFIDFASYYVTKTKEMSGSLCKSFELEEFLNTTLGKLQSHNVNKALIFPVPNGFGLNVSISKLIEDINEELENRKKEELEILKTKRKYKRPHRYK